jgi:hypothetical protein
LEWDGCKGYFHGLRQNRINASTPQSGARVVSAPEANLHALVFCTGEGEFSLFNRLLSFGARAGMKNHKRKEMGLSGFSRSVCLYRVEQVRRGHGREMLSVACNRFSS